MTSFTPRIKYPMYIAMYALVIAGLFLLFQGFPVMIIFLKYFVFPGILFLISGALFYDWYERKVYAHMQTRIGPRFIQPVFDVVKLLAKEDITPDGVDKPEFNIIPPFQLLIALLIAFLMPVYIAEGLISFEVDLIFFLFLLAVIGSSILLLGWASNNPYGLIGGSRAAVAQFSFEIPLTIAFIGPAILAGSLRISDIVRSKFNLIDLPLNVIFQRNGFTMMHLLYLIPLLILFAIAILAANAVLEKIPFDPEHAEVEIVGGWMVELSGKKFLFCLLANRVTEFALAGIIAAVFFGGPGFSPLNTWVNGILFIGSWDIFQYLINIITFFIKTTVIVFLITLVRAIHARFRIDQLIHYFWRYYLPVALLALFMIVFLVGVI